jgi:hypothetical protein
VRGATIGGGGVPAGDTDPDFIDEGPNRVTDAYGTVAGGYANVAGDDAGLVLDNTFATVGGGRRNTASGGWSTVAGGRQNTASNVFSTIPGGFRNTASGWGSFAAGFDARADQDQCFVFSNWSITQQGPDTWGSCLGLPNIVRFFADRGLSVHFHTRLFDGSGDQWVYFGDFFAGRMIATSSGAHLTDTGMWTNASDRALKDGFAAVDTQAVLESVVKLPVARWHYRRDGPVVEHIGPTAQDFHAAFGLGRNDTTIGTVDADGVALAAIQGLNAKLEAKLAARDVEVAALVFELRSLRDELASLRARLPPDAQPR